MSAAQLVEAVSERIAVKPQAVTHALQNGGFVKSEDGLWLA